VFYFTPGLKSRGTNILPLQGGHRILLVDYVSKPHQKWSELGAKGSRRNPEGSGGRNLTLFVYFYVVNWLILSAIFAGLVLKVAGRNVRDFVGEPSAKEVVAFIDTIKVNKKQIV